MSVTYLYNDLLQTAAANVVPYSAPQGSGFAGLINIGPLLGFAVEYSRNDRYALERLVGMKNLISYSVADDLIHCRDNRPNLIIAVPKMSDLRYVPHSAPSNSACMNYVCAFIWLRTGKDIF